MPQADPSNSTRVGEIAAVGGVEQDRMVRRFSGRPVRSKPARQEPGRGSADREISRVRSVCENRGSLKTV